jgi:hypothetical protein
MHQRRNDWQLGLLAPKSSSCRYGLENFAHRARQRPRARRLHVRRRHWRAFHGKQQHGFSERADGADLALRAGRRKRLSRRAAWQIRHHRQIYRVLHGLLGFRLDRSVAALPGSAGGDERLLLRAHGMVRPRRDAGAFLCFLFGGPSALVQALYGYSSVVLLTTTIAGRLRLSAFPCCSLRAVETWRVFGKISLG